MVCLSVLDSPMFVALIEPIFLDPIHQRSKDFQAASGEPLPHGDDSSFERIIGLGEIKAKIILVDRKQLCTVFLASASCCWVDDSRNPQAPSPYSCGMDRRFGLASIVFAVQVHHIVVAVPSSPQRSSSLPAHIERVALRHPIGDDEWIAEDFGFGDWIDGALTEGWFAEGAGFKLVRRDAGFFFRDLFGGWVRGIRSA